MFKPFTNAYIYVKIIMHIYYATCPQCVKSHTPLIFPGELHLGFFLISFNKPLKNDIIPNGDNYGFFQTL